MLPKVTDVMTFLRPVAALSMAAALSGCGGTSEGSGETLQLEVWAHDGTDAERAVLEQQVETYNARQDAVEVTLSVVAEGDYNDTLQSAVARGDLPDIAEIDGPLLASYAYQDVLAPLDDLLSDEVIENQLASLQAQGNLDGHLYGVGTFDSGLGIYGNREALRAAGVVWPTSPDDAWAASEFGAALEALARHDDDGRVLDVKLNYGVGEWLTYGFAPLVSSAGGELIDPLTLSPSGHLDGRETKSALDTLRAWAPFLDPNEDDKAFVDGRVALSWVGHWTYRDYKAALGDDLVILPLPDLGNGTKTGQGSWAWGVTAEGDARQGAAADFLTYLLTDTEVLRMTEANGAVPGTTTALAQSTLYGEGGPLALFAEQLNRSCGDLPPTRDCVAVPRPSTPGYAVLSSQFAEAVATALAGNDADHVLESASEFVADDLAANNEFAS